MKRQILDFGVRCALCRSNHGVLNIYLLAHMCVRVCVCGECVYLAPNRRGVRNARTMGSALVVCVCAPKDTEKYALPFMRPHVLYPPLGYVSMRAIIVGSICARRQCFRKHLKTRGAYNWLELSEPAGLGGGRRVGCQPSVHNPLRTHSIYGAAKRVWVCIEFDREWKWFKLLKFMNNQR